MFFLKLIMLLIFLFWLLRLRDRFVSTNFLELSVLNGNPNLKVLIPFLPTLSWFQGVCFGLCPLPNLVLALVASLLRALYRVLLVVKNFLFDLVTFILFSSP